MSALGFEKTLHPVSFTEFQRMMNLLGYGMERHSVELCIIYWRLDRQNTTIPHNGPLLITIKTPDFSNPNHTDPVYERDYVMDLLNSTMAGDFDKNGLLIRAILQKEIGH